METDRKNCFFLSFQVIPLNWGNKRTLIYVNNTANQLMSFIAGHAEGVAATSVPRLMLELYPACDKLD